MVHCSPREPKSVVCIELQRKGCVPLARRIDLFWLGTLTARRLTDGLPEPAGSSGVKCKIVAGGANMADSWCVFHHPIRPDRPRATARQQDSNSYGDGWPTGSTFRRESGFALPTAPATSSSVGQRVY